KSVKGLGAASVTEILAFVHPSECAFWNDRARKALDLLGFRDVFPAVNRSQINGKTYQHFNELMGWVHDELVKHGFRWVDLLDVNYFLTEVWRAAQESTGMIGFGGPASRAMVYEFDHTEVVDQLVAIGQWLGFQAEKEKTVARGARVDLIWQARIANLGVVTYAFEVQRRGSIDSLILNLQRAQNNPTVQRLVVVANPDEIERIRQELATMPET